MTTSKKNTSKAAGRKPAASSKATKATSIEEVQAEPAVETKDDLPRGPVVVIPYLGSASAGDELRYAMRAWAKHLPGATIVVIGDRETWFSKEVIHIPFEKVSDNPQIDVAHRMIAAVAAEEVPDFFIWSNYDIYPLAPVMISDIDTLKASGRLAAKGSPGGIYAANAKRTVEALRQAGIKDPYDYATHTPVTLYKDKLADTIKQFNCLEEGHLVYSLYANTHWLLQRPIITNNAASGSIIASVFRPDPNKDILERAIAERRYLNNNDRGWKAVEPYLAKLFGSKCRFEK